MINLKIYKQTLKKEDLSKCLKDYKTLIKE